MTLDDQIPGLGGNFVGFVPMTHFNMGPGFMDKRGGGEYV
jgi:hypothetical protein